MNKFIPMVLFVILAAGLLAGGVWYGNKITEQSQQETLAQGVAAQEAQAQVMAKFKVTDVVVGTGAEAKNGDAATVNYIGTLDDGTKFDSSYDRKQPLTFIVGAGKVIKGWDLGVLGMKVGGKRTLVIPPELAYGARANGPVPANATLHFTVELMGVNIASSTL